MFASNPDFGIMEQAYMTLKTQSTWFLAVLGSEEKILTASRSELTAPFEADKA